MSFGDPWQGRGREGDRDPSRDPPRVPKSKHGPAKRPTSPPGPRVNPLKEAHPSLLCEEEATTRVLIVDDQPLLAESLGDALESLGMDVVDAVSTGEEAVASAERSHPDIVLMDLGVRGQSGLAAGRSILKGCPKTKILALAARNDRAAVQEAARIGFVAYVTTDVSVVTLASSIRAAADGQLVVCARLSPTRRKPRSQDEAVLLISHLTRREREVLALLGEGASAPMIAKKLSISPNTVRTHVQNILTKLQLHSRLEAAAFAVRHQLADSGKW